MNDPPPLPLGRMVAFFVYLLVSGVLVSFGAGAYVRWYKKSLPPATQVAERAAEEDDAVAPGDVCAAHYVALRHMFREPQHVLAANRGQLLLEGGLMVKVTGAYFVRAGTVDWDSLARASLIGHEVKLVLPDLAAFRGLYTPETRSSDFAGEAPASAVVAGAHYGVVPAIADLTHSR